MTKIYKRPRPCLLTRILRPEKTIGNSPKKYISHTNTPRRPIAVNSAETRTNQAAISTVSVAKTGIVIKKFESKQGSINLKYTTVNGKVDGVVSRQYGKQITLNQHYQNGQKTPEIALLNHKTGVLKQGYEKNGALIIQEADGVRKELRIFGAKGGIEFRGSIRASNQMTRSCQIESGRVIH